jgi:hypothetical protein
VIGRALASLQHQVDEIIVVVGRTSDNGRIHFARRDPTRRFVRAIHERVDPAFTSVGKSRIFIQHRSVSSKRRNAKLYRNHELLDHHLAAETGDIYGRTDRIHNLRALAQLDWTGDLRATLSLVDWSVPASVDSGNLAG